MSSTCTYANDVGGWGRVGGLSQVLDANSACGVAVWPKPHELPCTEACVDEHTFCTSDFTASACKLAHVCMAQQCYAHAVLCSCCAVCCAGIAARGGHLISQPWLPQGEPTACQACPRPHTHPSWPALPASRCPEPTFQSGPDPASQVPLTACSSPLRTLWLLRPCCRCVPLEHVTWLVMLALRSLHLSLVQMLSCTGLPLVKSARQCSAANRLALRHGMAHCISIVLPCSKMLSIVDALLLLLVLKQWLTSLLRDLQHSRCLHTCTDHTNHPTNSVVLQEGTLSFCTPHYTSKQYAFTFLCCLCHDASFLHAIVHARE